VSENGTRVVWHIGDGEPARGDLFDAETLRRRVFSLVIGGSRRLAKGPKTGLWLFGIPGMPERRLWMARRYIRATSACDDRRFPREDMLIPTYYAGKGELA